MARETVNEGSTSYHALSFRDQNGLAVAPESIRYRLMGDASAVLLDWQTTEPDAVEIEIPATLNVIGPAGGKKRYLTVECTHNEGDKITSEAAYTLVDLKGV